MQLNTWVKTQRGRATQLAKHFGITLSAVSQWRKNGVPVAHMKAVRDFTEKVVTLEDMLPSPKRRGGGK